MFYRLLAGFVTLVLLIINAHLYKNFDQDEAIDDVIKQLAFLGDALRSGAGKDMQKLFPEGFFFSHVLYGLAWAEIGKQEMQSSPLRQTALSEANWALDQLDSRAAKWMFDPNLNPPHGAFYVGWSSWLRGNVLAIQNRDSIKLAEAKRFIDDCSNLSFAFSRTPFIESYHRQAWPADALVGVAALRLHDQLFAPRFSDTISNWIMETKKRLDPGTGLLPHAVDFNTGYPTAGARGSSQALMIRFLAEIDRKFAQGQYLIFRKPFVTSVFGLPGIREYPFGQDGKGDVDSGPVIFSIGAAATIVALGTARTMGDNELAESLEQCIETVGLPTTWGKKKFYVFGQMPIGDAFLVWSKAASPRTLPRSADIYPSCIHWWWRFPLHALTVIFIVLVWSPVIFRKSRGMR